MFSGKLLRAKPKIHLLQGGSAHFSRPQRIKYNGAKLFLHFKKSDVAIGNDLLLLTGSSVCKAPPQKGGARACDLPYTSSQSQLKIETKKAPSPLFRQAGSWFLIAKLRCPI